MSVEIPVVAITFGSVTPPQGDVSELRVHLGCTKEVSSFECLLQNFDKKYTVTNPVNVGDNCSISIGRGANCPLILTGRVEEIEPESTPVENYIRVRGRCWGEKIFRRVVTKTYENQKGEAIVKDLLDNYVGLSHVRDSTELVENTDTAYTLLEYKDTPVFDILKYIAETADKSGVIGFDFRVEWDGKFAFFPKNSKTSPISLSEKIEHSRCSKDIHRVRNKIKVYGAAEKPYPLDTDGQPWSDSLTEDLTKPDNYLQHADGKWEPLHPTHETLSIETTIVHTGSKSVKIQSSSYDYYMGITFTFDSDKYVNGNRYPKLCFTLREDNRHNKRITVGLKDKDGNDCWQSIDIADYDEWQSFELRVGKANQESWTLGNSEFDWENIKEVRFDFHQNSSQYGTAYVDRMHFGGCRWEAAEEDSSSQSSCGLRELVEVDEELHSDHECSLRGKALLNHLSQPAEFLTLRTTCLDYDTDRLLPGDKIHVTLPNENIDDDYRIISVEYRVSARDQTLEITLELGKEKPLLADYLYGLRSTTITVEKLMRTKAGLTGGGFVGGGGGADEKVKVSSTDTTTNYLFEKLLAGEGITLTKKNSGADEDLEIKAHRKWSWADEQGWIRTLRLPYGRFRKDVNWTNPILSPTAGAWDHLNVQGPCCICHDGKYWLFYFGYGGSPTKYRIGVAYATQPWGPYTKSANNPLIDITGQGCYFESVIYDEIDEQWKMWFLRYDGTQAWYRAHASNPEGPWTVDGAVNSYPASFLSTQGVLRLGNMYWTPYRANSSPYPTHVMYSEDGDNWTEQGRVINVGAGGEWDDANIGYVSSFWNLGTFYVIYGAYDGSHLRIGIATSPYGFRYNSDEFFKSPLNPTLDVGSAGAWDDLHIAHPSLMMIDNKFYLWYTGQRSTANSHRIGLAQIP